MDAEFEVTAAESPEGERLYVVLLRLLHAETTYTSFPAERQEAPSEQERSYKLVFDNEVCGQCLHFVRELEVLDDLPTDQLVADLMAEDHLITSKHTLEQWPKELYLTDPVIDRANRETWEETGSNTLWDRACAGVEERLANYTPIETDAAVDAAMRKLILDGLDEQDTLPGLPPPPEPKAKSERRGRRKRRRRAVNPDTGSDSRS